MNRPDFSKHLQDPDVLLHLQDVLDVFAGLATAIDPVANQDYVFPFCARYFEQFSKIMEVYHGMPEITLCVLVFWESLVEHLGIYRLPEPQRQLVFHSCLNVLKIYAAANTGLFLIQYILSNLSLLL
jgi:hypothetical protein